MAPVAEGMIRMESLISGEVNISHVALANDFLAVRAENRLRASEK